MSKFIQVKISLSTLMLLCLSPIQGYEQVKKVTTDTLRNVRLREVIVTATQPDSPGSISVIGTEAIQHVQATELSGLMQLLPGVQTQNPNLNSPAACIIRNVTDMNATNAFGTAIVVNGWRMSNNANLQQLGLEGSRSLFNSSVLSGLDVRAFPTTSIESVEVVRGIPSARYGDLTSGLIRVHSKENIQPYKIGLRFTTNEKLLSIGKGIATDRNGGILYLGVDYAFSEQTLHLPKQTFQRLSVEVAYHKKSPRNSLHAYLRGYQLLDKDPQGTNSVKGEYRKAINREISLSLNGQWKLNRQWISDINYQAGISYGNQKNKSSTYYSSTQQVTTYSTHAGEHEGVFLPPNYFTNLSVDGKPLNAQVSLIANLGKTYHFPLTTHLQVGLEVHSEGNRGKGIRFDPVRPPYEMLQMRARSYKSIPFVHHYNLFIEEKAILRTGSLRTVLQAGIRFSQLQTKAIHYIAVTEPRINLQEVCIDYPESSFLNYLSIRAGWGTMHKMPPLAYLYPDKAYTDKNGFTYNDTENNHRLTVMHTFVTDHTFNSRLRLPSNQKFELGINFRIKGVTTDIVWFKEHLKNGFCATTEAEPFSYRRYTPLTNKGELPSLTADGVVNKGHPLPYRLNSTFATYMRPQNGIEQEKQGVEYTIGPIQYPNLCSSFLISGRYLKVCERNTALTAYYPEIEVNGTSYPYASIYETDGSACNLQLWKQFNTHFQCITQLPRLGLVTTLTLQAVWMDKHRQGMESRYNNPIYLTDKNGNYLKESNKDNADYQRRLNPVFYIDEKGERHTFTQEMASDPRFSELVINAGKPSSFQTDSFKPYFLLNLRVTKEIGRHVSIAFCANNLTQTRAKQYSRNTQQYILLNPDLYYGAELNIRF